MLRKPYSVKNNSLLSKYRSEHDTEFGGGTDRSNKLMVQSTRSDELIRGSTASDDPPEEASLDEVIPFKIKLIPC